MKNHLLKETSDEVVYLRTILKKYKIDVKNSELSNEENLKAIDRFIRHTQIIHAKINFFDGLEGKQWIL